MTRSAKGRGVTATMTAIKGKGRTRAKGKVKERGRGKIEKAGRLPCLPTFRYQTPLLNLVV
jgi:hypothetical protein